MMRKRAAIPFFFMLVLLFSCAENIKSEGENDIVYQIATADNTELSELTFFELNILKNAVYSSKGYKYAEDRKWLVSYFKGDANYKTSAGMKWDITRYTFPAPGTVKFELDLKMKKALANVRVALYRKVRGLKNGSITAAVDSDYKKQGGYIFGRQVSEFEGFKKSIHREVVGYSQIISIVDTNRDFDSIELLGVYLGDVALLENIIEAKNGKEFKGTMAWEISQIAGITPVNKKYDYNKLDQKEKQKIIRLQIIKKRMISSDLGDLPDSLKPGSKRLVIETETTYQPKEEREEDYEYFEGC